MAIVDVYIRQREGVNYAVRAIMCLQYSLQTGWETAMGFMIGTAVGGPWSHKYPSPRPQPVYTPPYIVTHWQLILQLISGDAYPKDV